MNTSNFIFSLFIFFAMFTYAGAALLAVQFRKNRPVYVTYWIAGCLSTGTGIIFLTLREYVPEFISYKVGNALALVGGLLSNYAISNLSGKVRNFKRVALENIAAGLLAIAALMLVEINYGNPYQPTLIAFLNASIFLYGFFLTYQYYKKSLNIFGGVLALVYLLGGLIWLIRLSTIIFLGVGFAYQGGPINAVTYIALLLMGLSRYVIFTGLVLGIEEKERRDLLIQFNELKVNFANQKATQTEQRLRHVLNVTGDGIWDWNIQTGEVKHNDRWIEMLGEDPNQTYFSVEDFKNRIHPEDLSQVIESLENALVGKKEYRLQYRMIRSDQRQIWVEDRGDVVEKSPDGTPIRMVGAIHDVSDQIASKEKIEELIFFDPLTRLPNRQYIKDRIHRAIGEASRGGVYSGLTYLDLDSFKLVNDTYGHNIGDNLLREFGNRIQRAIRPTDMIARIGGDEYLILFERLGSTAESARVALEEGIKRILVELSEEFDLGEMVGVKATASMGAVVFGGDATQFDEVLKHADIAMYAAKEDPQIAYRFFDETLKSSFDRKNELHLGLKEAAEQDQFFVEYQPVVDRQQQCIGYEALARWKHPLLGMVMPDDFIPFAEKSGQMNEVGESILRNIFSNQSLWAFSDAHRNYILMINISAHQLMNLRFADQFILLAEQYQIPLERVHLEVTEGTFLTNTELAIGVMERLCSKGVQFVLDDFGTGYSSLAYLQKLPIEHLKLDKSFVAGMMANKDDQAIVDNILSLAKTLNIRVIAEGVETKEQFDLLLLKGCDFFQGWYFGRPGQIAG
ncbi:bifunctional diguanylate cyclase/phosphodiesterase [Polynucleobacter sp. AP-Titi-500A-B4]|uniref:putative bifunctional diguanylate cyclase/phosphodiesterase n=1 Tax=Polynucleobacter sp. AP-Titi-500A-B4 TaxID=2576923 RepID=UPI001BFD7C03|nr:GGDEF domain-containing phosphodiesterase [Polynucleobacter sp. AP-Titi-500A-B4]QWE11859.1 EAL domain-containing protein [Polynucleobacter sp. AP-Titi-500A-B4]